MSDGHWPPDVTVSRCRPQRWHQESPTMALNLKEDPVVMAPGNAISFWNILFFSDCSFPAYWKFQEQWALSAGNHPPWCQETQHSQSWADNQSSHGLYKAAWLCMPFGPRFFFFYCQHREDRVRKSLDLLFPVWPHWKSIFLFLLSLISLVRTSGFWVTDLSLLGPPGVRFLS